MRALNVLLAVLMSVLVAAAVLEGGLRLIGMGPQPTIHRFDPQLGWVKAPGAQSRRKTSEFDVTFKVNALGLRDDEMASAAKPEGTTRVVMLGDSFVLGYTVDRKDLFVDLLEQRWRSEGRPVDVINAGTEGWSTDQEVLWLDTQGAAFQPDLVVLFPYENDLYWNAKTRYERYPKPRFHPSGEVERITLADPGPAPVADRWALSRFFAGFFKRRDGWSPVPGGRLLPMEWTAYFRNDPEPMPEARARTRGALSFLQRRCAELGAQLVVVPVPNKASIEADAARSLASSVSAPADQWSPDVPVETFLALCADLGIEAHDPREFLRGAADGTNLYYRNDWHLNPEGNQALAAFLDAKLGSRLPAATREAAPMEVVHARTAIWSRGWVRLFAGLWAALSLAWMLTYRKDPAWHAPLKTGVMLALVFTIVLGGTALLEVLGKWHPLAPKILLLAFVATLVTFILAKLGRRIGTILELFACFVGRGHWYLIPLVVVLTTIGSLLVVAASSPLVAPFIYTLF